MIDLEIKYCPGSLREGFTTYSPAVLKNMFFGKKVSHILDFDSPQVNPEVSEKFRQNSKIISISGAQLKQSLLLGKNKLRLTNPGEQGQYILKPIPFRPPFGKAEELAANEHLTMQIARQVFGINTAESVLIFFKNGEPAYITKRFDLKQDGGKIAQEDFATLSGISKEKHGKNYQTTGSYYDLANLMKKYVSAYPVEIEKFFEQVLFNYLFHNGDAHLKNFSLQQTANGDYVLSPAYDLMNTSVHLPSDSFFALNDGLFVNDFNSDSFLSLGFYSYDDFYDFGLMIGLLKSRLKKILNKYRISQAKVAELIQHSFLSEEVKHIYAQHYAERVAMLNHLFSKKNSQ
jgi:serine/threonine-protein kinase HipA